MDTCTSSRSTGSLSLTQGLSLMMMMTATAGGVSLHHHLLLLHLHVIAGGATTKRIAVRMAVFLAQMTTSQLLPQIAVRTTTSQLLNLHLQIMTQARNLNLNLHLQIMTPERHLRITTPANRGR